MLSRDRMPIVTIEGTLTNGDCFFSAIYRAADEQNLLNNLKECHDDLNITNETEFIQSLRNMVSENSESSVRFLYDTLRGYFTANNNNINSVQTLIDIMGDDQGFDAWHKTLINKYVLTNPPNLKKFIEKFKEGLKQKGHYSADVEINIVKELFEPCNIRIVSHSLKKFNLLKKEGGNDIIHISNNGGGHFEFYSFNTTKNSNKSPTRKNSNKSPKKFGITIPNSPTRRSPRQLAPTTTRKSRSVWRRALGFGPKKP